MTVNREQAERAVVELLKAFGRDPATDPALAQAPKLVVESWEKDWLYGYDVNIAELLSATTESQLSATTESQLSATTESQLSATTESQLSAAPVVVVSRIAVSTLCPHHLLPAEGEATVAYLPGEHLLGIGTLARLVDAYSRRFTLQEQIGADVVAALMHHGQAKGAYCRLDMQHGCLRLRGAKQSNANVTTTYFGGVFANAEGRRELEAALRQGCA